MLCVYGGFIVAHKEAVFRDSSRSEVSDLSSIFAAGGGNLDTRSASTVSEDLLPEISQKFRGSWDSRGGETVDCSHPSWLATCGDRTARKIHRICSPGVWNDKTASLPDGDHAGLMLKCSEQNRGSIRKFPRWGRPIGICRLEHP